jgi:biotin transporter BioY
MPIGVPDVTPTVQRVARITFGYVFVFVAVVLAAGWVVGHLTSSIGWGFVAMVAGLLLELPITMLLLNRFQPVLATLPTSGFIRKVVSPTEVAASSERDETR